MTSKELETLKQRVDQMLLAMLGSELLVQRWWNSQNFHFNLEKPYLVWEVDPESVYRYVAGHVGGSYY